MTFGKLVIRLVVGGLFVGHGLQKLRGSFGGPGLSGTEQMMTGTGMLPARRNALAAAWTETAGGAAIAAGFLTPVAAAGLISVMSTAIAKVHARNGVWNAGGGFEYNAVLIATLIAITDDGPGAISLDAVFGKKRWGVLGALFSIVAGGVGSYTAIELGRRSAESAPSPSPEAGVTE